MVVRDLEASLRFYRDGLGLDLLADRRVEGSWPDLFDAPSRSLRAVFLGDARQTRATLSRVEELVSPLPVPDRPEHHYRYDPPRAQFYVATTLVHCC